MNVRPSRPLLRYPGLGDRLVSNEADNNIARIARQLVQELPLQVSSISMYIVGDWHDHGSPLG